MTSVIFFPVAYEAKHRWLNEMSLCSRRIDDPDFYGNQLFEIAYC